MPNRQNSRPPGLPEPVPAPEVPHPPFGYLSSGFLGSRPPPPPASVAHAGGSSSSPTTASPAPQPATPVEIEMQPPATAPANQQPEADPRPRRSPRLNPEPGRVCAIKGPPGNPPHQSENPSRMAGTYPLLVPYNQCLVARVDPLSFASLRLEDLRNGQSQYLSTMRQLVEALLKTEDPYLRFALRGHIAHPGQKRLRRSMRVAIWWLLPSDGVFRRAYNSLQYYLTRQGRRVVLRGGDVTRPPLECCLNWVIDPMPPHSCHPDDLAAPSPSENTPPRDAPSKLPRQLRSRRRREKQPGLSTNENTASCMAGPATQLRPAANQNSARPSSSSAANRNSPLPGQRPGTSRSSMSAPVEHPLTFLCPQHSQYPKSSAK